MFDDIKRNLKAQSLANSEETNESNGSSLKRVPLEPTIYHDIPTNTTTVDDNRDTNNIKSDVQSLKTPGEKDVDEQSTTQTSPQIISYSWIGTTTMFAVLWKYLSSLLSFFLSNDTESTENEKNTQSIESSSITTQPSKQRLGITIICISDTHGEHRKLSIPNTTDPCNTILIHAGDYTKFGKKDHVIDFNDWLGSLPPYKAKIVVNGNHECNAQWKLFVKSYLKNATVLIDESVDLEFEIDARENKKDNNDGEKEEALSIADETKLETKTHTLKIHGTNFYWPCHDLHNPNYDSIHPSTDILITHCPVQGYVDNQRGCPTLLHMLTKRKQEEKSIIQPKVVICGHEHLGTGVVMDNELGVTFVNAANAKGGPRGGHSLGKQSIILTL